MSDKTLHPAPLSRTLFPFPKSANAGDGQAQAAEANAGEYFQALSEAEDGFFPIGYNGQWHGGIHFGAETGRHLAQDEGIRCIADGQVIAYRIDEEYPTVKYESCAPATYSRGFVLVRHRLQLPPARQTTTDTNGDRPAEEGEQPSLVFYSLYMHLRNSRAYADDPDLKRPAFWDGSIYLVGERGLDNDPFTSEPVRAGMNIRDANHRVVGFAPRGVKLKLGEPNPARRSYYRITEVVAGSTYPDDVVGMYVYKGTGTSREGLDPASEPHAKGSVYILPEPVEIKAGDIVGHLGEYQRYLDMDALAQCSTGRPLAQVDVFTHEDLPGFIEQSRLRDAELEGRQKTLLHIKPGARLVQPSEPDVVLSKGEAVVVTGGDTDGRWIKGRRGTVSIVDEKPSGFSSTTRAYGDGRIFLAAVDAAGNELTLEQLNALTNKNTHPRRKLLTPVGEEVWVSSGSANSQSMVTAPANVWSGFPLQVANAGGEAVAHSRVVPVGSIEQVVKEADDIRWFQVEAGTSSSGEVSGWVRESGHANVELCSPWAWPGFELFDVGELEPRELFARELANSRRAQPQEQEEFEGAARNIEESPLFDALGKAIDADGNQQVTPLELRSAMNTQWLAQAISRLVIRYPSEWSDPTDRWSRIDGLIEDEVLRKDWGHEKGRIRELVIWPDIAKQHDFPSDSTVHHFHPIGFVENFFGRNSGRITVEMLRRIFTNAPESRLQIVADGVNAEMVTSKLDSEWRLTHFFGQVLQEVGKSMMFRENLNYSASGLYKSRFSYYRNNKERSDRDAGNEEAIANNAYADANRAQEFRVGNTEPGDGWRYRGRGLKQTTGRYNYRIFTTDHERIWGERIDFEAHPERVDEPTYAVRSGLTFWVGHRLYEHADLGITEESANRITNVINSGTGSYVERWQNVQKIWGERVFRDAF
ncbi:MAG TPA: hypothetical protein H9827_06700 [Candidatus Luteimonas excrementigallinarum]|nr:hypothetical protein [Candidatus Luteimonas excrementigallinarum]